MRRAWWVLLLVAIPVGLACAQDDACNLLLNVTPLRCPNSGCHQLYPSILKDDCNTFEECVYLFKISWCCGAYMNWSEQGACLETEMRDTGTRSRILELAKKEEILVPACDGAFIPARIALRERKEKSSGGL